MSEINNRFDLMFDDAEEYVEQQEKERKESKKAAAKERRKIEEKGLCEGCNTLGYNRWVDDEAYLCYKCFYEGMQQAGEFYSIHGRRAEDMEGFMYNDEWEERWENNE